MVLRKSIDQGLEKLYPLQVADRVKGRLLEKRKVLLNDVVAKGMEGVDVDFIGVRANKRQKPAPHRDRPRIGVGKTKDVARQHIRIQQDLSDTGGQDLRLTRSRSRYDHDRPFRTVHGKPLTLIQSLVF